MAATEKNKQAAENTGRLPPLRGAILDVDGTLLDSMPMWDQLAAKFLRGRGLQPEPDVNEKIKDMTVTAAGRYFQKQYGLQASLAEIEAGVRELVRHYYAAEAELKPGVRDFLEFLHRRQVPLCLATVTEAALVRSALERHGVLPYFSGIITCREAGGKDQPGIFLQARELLGTPLAGTYVFEDSYYAMATAKAAGFPVVAVFDASSAVDQASIQKLADLYVRNLTETEVYLHV